MKSLNIDIIFPWEIGLGLVIFGFTLIILGVKQSKREIDDFNKIPVTKPTTKIFFGSILCIFGFIQMLPLIKQI